MSEVKRYAQLTIEEDARWIEVFTDAVDEGTSDEQADLEAWETLCDEFPRLQAYDGILPTSGEDGGGSQYVQ